MMRKNLWRDAVVSLWIVGMTVLYIFYGLSYLKAVQSITARFIMLFDHVRALL